MVKKYETGYIKYIMDDEFKRIKLYLRCNGSPPIKMCIKLMMVMGMRIGDSVKLKRDNFSKDFSKLTYEMQKTKKLQNRMLPNFLQRELQLYYKKYCRRMKDGYLFFASWRNQSKNLHLQRSTINFFFGYMRKELGLDHVYYTCKGGKKLYRISPHTLRHYAAWRYYQASGYDIRAVQQLLGHSDIKTTSLYIHALKETNRELEIVSKAFAGIS